ncbi:LLM class flavin-dependent oxidoreductase [Enemella evansiae]|uniref:LLM class flavin-dependent oxidoreductase n=1 Tax=Enemella evansiae TaxID=2016499 RepID=UPI000B96E4BF|nr:LLM class flavin-dependent oxidoreductase [Enemella evansiae]OYO00213.1 LLM class flavin-dependent oxidoreductase [Enemella evansiae]OYO04922.1 LLM class flavin-dependent oxidoreductase [Enemella evansiae]OYO09071.1 LLM class flavin-dependent oxidoreductase [Enemella evansiae]
MKFSIYLNAQSPGPAHDREVIEAVTEQAKIADAAGFASICLTDHHFTGYNTYGNPFTYGAYLYPQLPNRTPIVLSVAVPALGHPLNFAEQCNLLDMLTQGNCVIGIGSGGSPHEYIGLGRDQNQRAALTDEVVDVALAALEKELDDPDLEYETAHSKGVLKLRIMPTSWNRRPRFARAALSEQGALRAAELGWPLMTGRMLPDEIAERYATYYSALDAAGHDAETIRYARDWSLTQKIVYVGETDEQAMEAIQKPLDYITTMTRNLFAVNSDTAGFKNSVVGVSPEDRDAFVEKAMLVGSPDTIAAQIDQYAAAGIGHMSFVFLFGQLPVDAGRRSLQLFIDKVMPRFGGTDA